MPAMTEQGLAEFQQTIHQKLVEVNYSQPNDTVFAEYVTTMIRNEKHASQINEELLELLGSAYNPEFGFWVESESKNPIYYQNAGSRGISEVEMITQDQLDMAQQNHEQSQNQDQNRNRHADSNRQSSRDESAPKSQPKLDTRNRLFESALKSSNQDRRNKSHHSADRGSKDRKSDRSSNKAISVKNRSSNSNSSKMDSEILSRLGKTNKASGRIEKRSQETSSPIITTIKGIAKKPEPSAKKQSILSRLGERDESVLRASENKQVQPLSNAQGMNTVNNPLYQMQMAQGNPGMTPMGYPGYMMGGPANNINFQNADAFNKDGKLPSGLYGLKRVKCSSWPMCNLGNECAYFHPTKICPKFPNCPLPAAECMFIHPHVQNNQLKQNTQSAHQKTTPFAVPCKFGAGCLNPNCHFAHPEDRKLLLVNEATNTQNKIPILCKFYPSCLNPNCPYLHTPAQPSNIVSNISGNPTVGGAILNSASSLQSDFANPQNGMQQGEAQTPNIPSGAINSDSNLKPGVQCDPSKKVPIQCRNGASCTRLDCHFLHPNEQAPPTIPCKFGFYCTRPDCIYSHPTRNLSLVNNPPELQPLMSNKLDHISDRPFATSITEVADASKNTDIISVVQSQNSQNLGSNQADNMELSQIQLNSQLVLNSFPSTPGVSSHIEKDTEAADDVVMSL